MNVSLPFTTKDTAAGSSPGLSPSATWKSAERRRRLSVATGFRHRRGAIPRPLPYVHNGWQACRGQSGRERCAQERKHVQRQAAAQPPRRTPAAA